MMGGGQKKTFLPKIAYNVTKQNNREREVKIEMIGEHIQPVMWSSWLFHCAKGRGFDGRVLRRQIR